MRLSSLLLGALLALTGIVFTSPLPQSKQIADPSTRSLHSKHDTLSHPAEKRQWQIIIVDVFTILRIIDTVIELIKDIEELANQHAVESNFTQTTVDKLRDHYPTMNVMVFHNQDSYTDFNGGNHTHYELDIGSILGIIHRTQGYEIWVFDSGDFELAGDGGYVNWCFDGDYDRKGNDVTFYSMNGDERAMRGREGALSE
ncbi:hypothetical protein H2200_003870 [Cladophialophora chaetospira]|uniref:Uncharacterized protein n=1 Tax=Cladophialophora chaetospira TaxID=386627 RepID=A0AA39CLI5_9EURO|nr:hypothetical protein H2200_003870 [Cladophialophora chaetospira]